ncbi:MAG: leucyl aminopeptidase family protein, partial [Candidatus Acidiferrales bacterium]
MEIRIVTQPAPAIATDALVTFVYEKDSRMEGVVAELDAATGSRLKALSDGGELTGKPLEMTLLHNPPGLAAQRLLLVGAGKPEKFTLADLRRAAGAALRHLKSRGVKRLAFLAHETHRDAAAAQVVAEGLLLADFEPDKYKSDKNNDKRIDAVSLAGFDATAAQAGVARGLILAESQNFARELINEPSNRMTPTVLAERAQAMAREAGLACQILDEKRMAEFKMGALLSVAQGSSEPPRLIVITHTPPQAKPGAPVLGLVGKAVTFDTGGISIKPSEGMEKMKYDMAGGATMI